MVTVDAVILYKNNCEYQVMLIKRNNPPYQGMWALPGGFVDMDEDLMDAVKREVLEETGICIDHFHQLAAYGTPGRDPRGRNIAVVYYTIVGEKLEAIAGDDAGEASWYLLENLPELAFDHQQIIEDAIKKVRD
jgi:8-oxo-dGTP diphosphatase